MGGDVIRFKNKSISKQKRVKNQQNKGFDLVEQFFMGNKKYQPWTCKKCGSDLS